MVGVEAAVDAQQPAGGVVLRFRPARTVASACGSEAELGHRAGFAAPALEPGRVGDPDRLISDEELIACEL